VNAGTVSKTEASNDVLVPELPTMVLEEVNLEGSWLAKSSVLVFCGLRRRGGRAVDLATI
jgi:hypothetical protein